MILFLTSLYNDRRVGRIGKTQEELKKEPKVACCRRLKLLCAYVLLHSQFSICMAGLP